MSSGLTGSHGTRETPKHGSVWVGDLPLGEKKTSCNGSAHAVGSAGAITRPRYWWAVRRLSRKASRSSVVPTSNDVYATLRTQERYTEA